MPTVNPPGEFYSDCVEYLNKRFKSKGFNTQIIRATPGNADRYPRQTSSPISAMARDLASTFSHIDVVAVGSDTQPPFEGKVVGDEFTEGALAHERRASRLDNRR